MSRTSLSYSPFDVREEIVSEKANCYQDYDDWPGDFRREYDNKNICWSLTKSKAVSKKFSKPVSRTNSKPASISPSPFGKLLPNKPRNPLSSPLLHLSPLPPPGLGISKKVYLQALSIRDMIMEAKRGGVWVRGLEQEPEREESKLKREEKEKSIKTTMTTKKKKKPLACSARLRLKSKERGREKSSAGLSSLSSLFCHKGGEVSTRGTMSTSKSINNRAGYASCLALNKQIPRVHTEIGGPKTSNTVCQPKRRIRSSREAYIKL